MRTLAKFVLAAITIGYGCSPFQASAAEPFTFKNVNGSYAFRFSGTDYAVTGKQIVATGAFTADGEKGISAGSISYNDGGNLCNSTTLVPSGSGYTVVTDGEGTLSLEFTAYSGSCPLQGTFNFATAIANPKSAVEQHIEMSSTMFTTSQDQTTQDVPVAGVAEHQ